jgi:hypothetical protein
MIGHGQEALHHTLTAHKIKETRVSPDFCVCHADRQLPFVPPKMVLSVGVEAARTDY